MATLIKFDGTKEIVQPEDGKSFHLEQLYKLLECKTIQICDIANPFDGGRQGTMIMDEEAKLRNDWEERINPEATDLWEFFYGKDSDVITGHALICKPSEFR